MDKLLQKSMLEKIKAELDELDRDSIFIDGIHLKPSQCYHLETEPAHVLFNTNCPDSLKKKVQAILEKYSPSDENSSQDN